MSGAMVFDLTDARFKTDVNANVMADSGYAASAVGPQWVGFDPWKIDEPAPVTRQWLARWAARAAGRSGAIVPRP